jgi:hypothetical protein
LDRLKGRDHAKDLGIDGRMLKWILGKQGLGVWIGFIWLGKGPVVGSCEYGNQCSGSIKFREFIE